MKCMICGTEIDSVKCSGCGFIRPRAIGNSELYQKMLQGLAEEYKKSLKIDVVIVATVYTYKMVDGKLEDDETKELILTENYAEETLGTNIWNDHQFARMETGTVVMLSGLIQNGEGKQEWKTFVKVPDTEGLWKIGLKPMEGLRFKILLGNELIFTESEALSVKAS